MEDSSAAFDATFCRKSLISNGPSFSYCLSVKSSIDFSLRVSDGEAMRGLTDSIKTMTRPHIVSSVLLTA